MLVKTSELSGKALDWAVAKCEIVYNGFYRLDDGEPPYSTSWAQGGPIIEREKIRLRPDNGWAAAIYHTDGRSEWFFAETPLIAAMRCYVASKLGDSVEVPDELTNN